MILLNFVNTINLSFIRDSRILPICLLNLWLQGILHLHSQRDLCMYVCVCVCVFSCLYTQDTPLDFQVCVCVCVWFVFNVFIHMKHN